MGYDEDLVRNEPGNLAAEEEAAFEKWVTTSLPDFDWDDEAAVEQARQHWSDYLDDLATHFEVDAAQVRVEERGW